jgi:CRP/FNR family transcriptional regulator, dissimilatory nitrate respiration regulator
MGIKFSLRLPRLSAKIGRLRHADRLPLGGQPGIYPDKRIMMTKTTANHSQSLLKLALFSLVEPEHIDKLADQARELRIGKGEILFQKGDRPHGFFVLLGGRINLAFPSEQGTERVLEVIKPGETFGEAMMFLRRPYPVFAQATLDSYLLDIPEQSIQDLLERDCRLARRMLAGISIRLHELVSNLEACSMRSSAQRVACMLQHYAPEKGLKRYDVELPTAKHTMASQLNLTPETFSRVLHVLSEAGLIEVSGRTIKVLDADKLKNLEV